MTHYDTKKEANPDHPAIGPYRQLFEWVFEDEIEITSVEIETPYGTITPAEVTHTYRAPKPPAPNPVSDYSVREAKPSTLTFTVHNGFHDGSGADTLSKVWTEDRLVEAIYTAETGETLVFDEWIITDLNPAETVNYKAPGFEAEAESLPGSDLPIGFGVQHQNSI